MHAPSTTPVRWDLRRFRELDNDALYALLRLRSEVFVVEQDCPYLDPDGKDRHPEALHVLGWAGPGPSGDVPLAAALRVLPPGLSYPEVSFGRVVIAPAFRGQGLGHALVREALAAIARDWPGRDVRIGAQSHLEAFYASHGFVRASEPYVEDGIPHIDMLRRDGLPNASEQGMATPDASGGAKETDYRALLAVAIDEARRGLAEGGIPIGAALFQEDGRLLGCGHNRRVQENDPSVHGETDAFRKAGRQRNYRDTIMVTTLAPCWYCSGLVRQFNIGTVVVGESVNFRGGIDWLRENGVEVIDLADETCIRMLGDWIAAHPDLWNEDIGED